MKEVLMSLLSEYKVLGKTYAFNRNKVKWQVGIY